MSSLNPKEKAPNPSTLVAVLALRDIDQCDIEPGVYRSPDGRYWLARFKRVNELDGKAVPLTVREASAQVGRLRSIQKPGMDLWDCALLSFLSDVQVVINADLNELIGRRSAPPYSLGERIIEDLTVKWEQDPRTRPSLLATSRKTAKPLRTVARRLVWSACRRHLRSKGLLA